MQNLSWLFRGRLVIRPEDESDSMIDRQNIERASINFKENPILKDIREGIKVDLSKTGRHPVSVNDKKTREANIERLTALADKEISLFGDL